MALYHQPTSLFCLRLHSDVILDIAFQLAILDPLGPPRHLPPLLRVCRYIADILAANKKPLLARIFRHKFDTRAPSRRLGSAHLTNSALAFQLKKQTLALKRLSTGLLDSENLLSDLWTAYLMFIENDGRNYSHLVQYARLDRLVDNFMETRLWAHRMHSGTEWPLDITPNALVIWLLWFTTTPDRLQAMLPDRRTRFMDLLRPFAIASLQYSPFFAPDNHFHFPIHESLRDNTQFPEGTAFAYFPMYREPLMVMERVIHYGREIPIMSPILGLGAKMVFLMLAEAVPYEPPSVLPINRAQANPADGVRPTQADFIEWASVRGVQLYDPGERSPLGAPVSEQGHRQTGTACRESKSASSRFDSHWSRLTFCIDPYRDLPLRPVVYTLGSIVGMFAGRMQIPELFRYREMVHGTKMPDLAAFPSLVEVPVYVRFREYHCINPSRPVPTGGSEPGFDDGLLNGYLPKSFDYQHVGNTLKISVSGSHSQILRYEEYVEGKANSHEPSKCEDCLRRSAHEDNLIRQRAAARHRSALMEQPPNPAVDPFDEDTDEEEEVDIEVEPGRRSRRGSTGSVESDVSYFYGDESDPDSVVRSRHMMLERDPDVEAIRDEMMTDRMPEFHDGSIQTECNGVNDIIITGETLPRHGEAWHHFRFYGRVRRWDGLIVLVRVPTKFPAAGTIIFRGYMLGNRNFVGSWRSYAENIQAIPVEGPFALSRIDEPDQPPASISVPSSSAIPIEF